MSLVITKETGGYFSFVVDGNIAEKVTNMRNDVLVRDGFYCDFKTANGANIIKIQKIAVGDITLIASGTFTFTDVETFLAKLIDVGFYDWLLGGGGSGSSTNRFDELIDTFGYFGKNGQAVRVNESQQKLETFTVYNYRKITDLEDTFSGIVPNKMLATSADGTKIELRAIPESNQQFLNAVGTFHYASTEQPLDVVANIPKKLTNDALGQYTNTTNAPYGVSSVWNSIDNDFNFNELSFGDLVHLRVDTGITTNSANQNIKIYLKLGIGSPSEFDLSICESLIKTSGFHSIISEVSFDLGYQDIVDFPAEIYLLSDGGGLVKVNGWYVEIVRKNINVVDIISDLGYVPENLDNKQNNLLPDGQGVKYPTVDAVNDGLKIETGANPSITTVDFGGIPAGTDIQNLTFNSILIDAMIAYLYPQFQSQSCNYPSTVEVGTTVSGNGIFAWSISNATNVKPNTVAIFDINNATNIATGLANDGSETVALNSILLNANNATQSWKIKSQNTKDENFESGNIVTTAKFRRFFGATSATPTTGTARSLGSEFQSANAQTFILNTGSTLTKFAVCLPSWVTISSVIDLDALNLNITSNYVSLGTININDIGGTSRVYNLYEMNIGAPYSANHRHQITTI